MRKLAAALIATLLSASGASAFTDAELKELSATIINLNGYLCAQVTDIRGLQLDGLFEVTCIEYRGGSGTVRYIMDPRKATAFPA